ncbi:hypothetical protein ACIRPK_34115 [Kitasatospora sp. NPDC101801]|uniref:hypothetical protein n=1 Tax=Bacillati TaxID=1783272 RepID=UPI0037FE358E
MVNQPPGFQPFQGEQLELQFSTEPPTPQELQASVDALQAVTDELIRQQQEGEAEEARTRAQQHEQQQVQHHGREMEITR